MSNSDQDALALLQSSLGDAQATVRAYDTKAQIVGVGYIFALDIISRIGDQLPRWSDDINSIAVALAWVVGILPIVLFGAVLYPTRASAQRFLREQQNAVERLLFVDPSKVRSIDTLIAAARTANLLDEVAFELMTVSMLRDTKRKRFLRGLFGAAFSFLFLFLFQLRRGLSA